MKKTFALLLILLSLKSFSQHEANHWFFGNSYGLDFSSGSPVPEAGSMIMTNEGTSAVSDRTTGDLLFYSDGVYVFDATHAVMPNGFGLFGNVSSSQSALVVPLPRSNNIYYVFTNDCFENLSALGCRYSIVDMSLHGGLGDVATKNILLFGPNSEQLSAVKHANCTDWWIMTKEANNNVYRAYLLTSAGLSGPVISTIGLPVSTFSAGQGKFSPDGSRYAIATANSGIVNKGICQLFDFDNSTGVLSNALTLVDSNWVEDTYGLSFSPDNSKLYVLRGVNGNFLYQYNLAAGTPSGILASATYLGTHGLTQMQLGKDHKIYLGDAPLLGMGPGVINNPNLAGTACGYSILSMPGFYSSGLCNFPDSYFNETSPCPLTMGAYVSATPVQCYGDSTGTAWVHAVYNNAGPYTVLWSPGGYTTDTIENLLPGTYTVTVTDSLGYIFVDTVTVTGPPALSTNITAPGFTICAGQNITLGPGTTGGTATYQYNWSTGDTTALVTTTLAASGNVSLTVTDQNGCTASDFVYIAVLPAPAISVSPDSCICAGENITLWASGAPGFVWSTGENTPAITVSPAADTQYTVQSTGTTCTVTDTVNICVHPLPFVQAAGDTVAEYLEPVTLLAEGDGPFVWSPADGLSCTVCAAPLAQPAETTLYTVTATNVFGCTASDNVLVNIVFQLSIPNIITPNGDGINDIFTIKGLPPGSGLQLFNRWGNQVFATGHYLNNWSAQADGVYYYVLETPDGKTFSGFVQVTGN